MLVKKICQWRIFFYEIINNFSRISMKFKLLRKYKEIYHVWFGLWISNIYQIQKKERLFQRKTHYFGWLNIQTTKYKIRHSICQKKKHSKSYLERTQFMEKKTTFFESKCSRYYNTHWNWVNLPKIYCIAKLQIHVKWKFVVQKSTEFKCKLDSIAQHEIRI